MESLDKQLAAEETPPYREHQGAHRQYVRDIILGVNDGLVSTFLLVVAVVGGGLSAEQVLLAGIAAAIAGAVSMAAGEYVATKSQEEVLAGEMDLEREHLRYHREHELDELREMFGEMGLNAADTERVVMGLDKDDDAMMKVMMALEFGFVETERRSPLTAMAMSGLLFLVGAVPSVVPFAILDNANSGLVLAAILSGIGLFAVGIAKTFATRGNKWRGGFENLSIAIGGGLLAYLIGSLFEAGVS